MHYPSGIAPAPISTEAKARRRLGKRPRMRCHLYDAAVWVTAGAVSQRRRSRRLVFVSACRSRPACGYSARPARCMTPSAGPRNHKFRNTQVERPAGHSRPAEAAMGPFWQPICAVADYRCSGAVQQSRPLRAVVAQFPDLGAWPPPNSLRNQKWLPVRLFCRQWRGRDLWRFPPRHLQVAPDRRLGLQAQPRGGGAVRP